MLTVAQGQLAKQTYLLLKPYKEIPSLPIIPVAQGTQVGSFTVAQIACPGVMHAWLTPVDMVAEALSAVFLSCMLHNSLLCMLSCPKQHGLSLTLKQSPILLLPEVSQIPWS